MPPENKLVVFKGKNIRRTLHQNEWWFSVIDVVEVLTASERPRKHWSDLKKKLIKNEGFNELSEKIGQLKLEIESGRLVVSKENYLPEKKGRKRVGGL